MSEKGSFLWHRNAPASKSSKLVPLAVAILVIVAVAWISYQVYATIVRFKHDAARRMGKKHVVWSKDGVRVEYRYIEAEKYVGQTQSVVVKAWNLARGHDEETKSKSLKDRWRHLIKGEEDIRPSS